MRGRQKFAAVIGRYHQWPAAVGRNDKHSLSPWHTLSCQPRTNYAAVLPECVNDSQLWCRGRQLAEAWSKLPMKTPAGWYPNPDGSPSERYWDGGRWTNDQRTPRTFSPRGSHEILRPASRPGESSPPYAGNPHVGGPHDRRQTVGSGHLGHWPPQPGPVERGSNRWMIGVAIFAVALCLALTSFAEWGRLSYAASDGGYGSLKVSATLSGFGGVSVDVPGIKDSTERGFVEHREASALEAEGPNAPGVAALALGLLMAGSAWLFLQNRHRLRAMIVIVVAAATSLINGLWRMVDVRGMFNDPADWSTAHYSAGFGLVAATVAAFALMGLGITAVVLERRSDSSPRAE